MAQSALEQHLVAAAQAAEPAITRPVLVRLADEASQEQPSPARSLQQKLERAVEQPEGEAVAPDQRLKIAVLAFSYVGTVWATGYILYAAF